MSNLREVNDDILKEWIECRESTLFPFTNDEDKKHDIYFDEFFENILRNVPDQNKKYVKRQFDKIDENFLLSKILFKSIKTGNTKSSLLLLISFILLLQVSGL